jgi:hypothetical protein
MGVLSSSTLDRRPFDASVMLVLGRGAQRRCGSRRTTLSPLPREMLAELVEVGLCLERHFCTPQDIEWAVVDSEVFVLQSRPITTLGLRPSRRCVGEHVC